jgi:hypothetical protein
LLAISFLLWTITSSVDFQSATLLPQLLDRLRFLLFALALLLFPDGRWNPSWTRVVAGASAIVCLLGIVETLGLAPTAWFLPLAVLCILAAIGAQIARFRSAESDIVRQQLKWIALGLVAGIGMILGARAGAALSSASPVLPALPILWEALFQLGIVTIALGFLMSLLRYRLFDAETAISRSATLAALTVMIVAIFAGTEASIEWVGQQYLGMGIGNVSAAMAAAVAAVILNPLHDRISDWAEAYFQRDLVALKRELPVILADLAASGTVADLGRIVLPRINEAVHATRSALIVEGKLVAVTGTEVQRATRLAKSLRSNEAPGEGSIFPVSLPVHCPFSGGTGWLALGPRPDGSLYGKDDLDALEEIRSPLRRALSATIARETARSENKRQMTALRRELELLRRSMASRT